MHTKQLYWSSKIELNLLKNCTKLIYGNVEFEKKIGGKTPGPPLREGRKPSRTHSLHGRARPCATDLAPPYRKTKLRHTQVHVVQRDKY